MNNIMKIFVSGYRQRKARDVKFGRVRRKEKILVFSGYSREAGCWMNGQEKYRKDVSGFQYEVPKARREAWQKVGGRRSSVLQSPLLGNPFISQLVTLTEEAFLRCT